MENKYFSVENTLYQITAKYPETIEIFVAKGFEQMKDKKQRETFGKVVTLKQALKLKQMDTSAFSELLLNTIKRLRENIDVTTREKVELEDAKIKIQGLLPCPVRIPLLETFEEFLKEETDEDFRNGLGYELKAASMGLDWLKADIERHEDADMIADVFISAGFDLFFDKELIGKYKDKKVFKDFSGLSHYNKDFENDEISLKDPRGDYSMIGVVPAVFLVNTKELNGREVPQSWEDILKPEFENSLSLPVSDFDLFNAILVNIHKNYGEEGIKALSRNLLSSLHPAQMVKSHNKPKPPVVTIMPYFFTKTVKEGGPMTFVWPKDGAIISPIFMLTKAEKEKDLKAISEFFVSKKVGEVLSHKGLFPSINPEVDNKIPADYKYMWAGWDYIYENNIGEIIRHCEGIFNKEVEGK